MSTGIEWTMETWNPVVGCTPVSPGCLNCYAASMAVRLEGMGKAGYGPIRKRINPGFLTPSNYDDDYRTVRIAEVRGTGQNRRPVFTGEVRCLPDRLAAPLARRKPTTWFVNSMSDLFHEAVPFEFVDRVFAVMALCPQHTFQVLTKRPERMEEYLSDSRFREPTATGNLEVFSVAKSLGYDDTSAWVAQCAMTWPLPNVWLGASAEDQARLDERVPHLIRCPAAVRFLSVEPLLEELDLWAPIRDMKDRDTEPDPGGDGRYLHWVIVGGESGPRARACEVGWIRGVVRQCRAAKCPVFVKQLGAGAYDGLDAVCEFTSYQQWVNKAASWLGGKRSDGARHSPRFEGVCVDARGRVCANGGDFMRARDDGSFPVRAHEYLRLADAKGGDPAEWPEDLRVREMPSKGGA